MKSLGAEARISRQIHFATLKALRHPKAVLTARLKSRPFKSEWGAAAARYVWAAWTAEDGRPHMICACPHIVYEVFADAQASAVVGQDFEGFDIVVGFSRHHGMNAAGVVADHAAKGAAVVRSGVGSEGEVVFFGGVAKSVEHDSGLHAGDAAGRVDFENLIHIAGKIEDNRDVAALSGKRGTAAAAEERGVEFTAERDCGDYVFNVAGKNYADGNLAVVGTIGGIEGAAGGVEPDIALKVGAKFFGESSRVGHWININPSVRCIQCRRSNQTFKTEDHWGRTEDH